ncbi:nucleoside diphosphate kinase regulator [Mesorhizobium sp. VK25A]|uniref:Nucleoside diphosphate kinase regulator n=1 Tax=Mesorhizobium vachelliae TaxID=3072309 RepID=A0ABU5A1T0_9HYPH|nr:MULTISPECIES: nucleoside diphosphate kinase regulator [unclassified Mesorhizobium]MDX8531636.1 nucleoside diphosphate kinase regulator [Mesorhizobium sp. VK25D]MDX8543921.1 nucleoside diphosphate kinase regulator [Mesorhizobium sp. VK25A]
MPIATQSRSRNTILVSTADHDRLSGLARAFLDRVPDMAEGLLAEMDRARIATDAAMPADVVRMGSTVTLQDPEGSTQTVTLVYPSEADIAERRISVLTPLGTALIGSRAGRTVSWRSRDSRVLSATIDAVEQTRRAP